MCLSLDLILRTGSDFQKTINELVMEAGDADTYPSFQYLRSQVAEHIINSCHWTFLMIEMRKIFLLHSNHVT
jgi:hypothetical protein